jgi:hypothetical protein
MGTEGPCSLAVCARLRMDRSVAAPRTPAITGGRPGRCRPWHLAADVCHPGCLRAAPRSATTDCGVRCTVRCCTHCRAGWRGTILPRRQPPPNGRSLHSMPAVCPSGLASRVRPVATAGGSSAAPVPASTEGHHEGPRVLCAGPLPHRRTTSLRRLLQASGALVSCNLSGGTRGTTTALAPIPPLHPGLQAPAPLQHHRPWSDASTKMLPPRCTLDYNPLWGGAVVQCTKVFVAAPRHKNSRSLGVETNG